MQKIITNFWFESAEYSTEAAELYTSLFDNSKIIKVDHIQEGVETPGGKPGDLLTIDFELLGQKFVILNGGPYFKMNPSISLFVECESEEQIDKLYNALVKDGEVLMELQKYDFSDKYAWINDKYGVSWQFSLGNTPTRILTALLYVGDQAGKAEEAMNLYTSLIPDSKINTIARYPEGQDKDRVMYAQFDLAGQPLVAMDSSLDHKFQFTEGMSLIIMCKDQEEVDKYWNALTADGGEESACGWLKDKFGVSWQIIPQRLYELMEDPDPERAKRAMNAMLKMQKLDIADLEKAADGK